MCDPCLSLNVVPFRCACVWGGVYLPLCGLGFTIPCVGWGLPSPVWWHTVVLCSDWTVDSQSLFCAESKQPGLTGRPLPPVGPEREASGHINTPLSPPPPPLCLNTGHIIELLFHSSAASPHLHNHFQGGCSRTRLLQFSLAQ